MGGPGQGDDKDAKDKKVSFDEVIGCSILI
jgi:hypothetical protein